MRQLARFWPYGQHIPGQPSRYRQADAGGRIAGADQLLYNVAPKDGTAFGIVAGQAAFRR